MVLHRTKKDMRILEILGNKLLPRKSVPRTPRRLKIMQRILETRFSNYRLKKKQKKTIDH